MVVFSLLAGATAVMQGSLDHCSETQVPWGDFRRTVFGFLEGKASPDLIIRLRTHALEGGLDPQDCDCWYGWMTTRFFVPLILDSTQRMYVLEEQMFHTEWMLWLGSPWVEMLDSPWDVPTVMAATAAEVPKQTYGSDSGCSALELRLLARVQAEGIADGATPSAGLARLAAKVLQQLPEAALLGGAAERGAPVWDSPCPGQAAAVAALLLGLAPHGFRVTVGYAYHVAQKALRETGGSGLLAFLASPWPAAALLPRVAKRMRAARERVAEIDEDSLAEQVVEASKAEFPEVPPSFLPPVTRRERLRLLEGLSVAHMALTAARVPYFTITGTLLGAMRHHGFVPWDGDADVCADIRDEARLLQVVLLQGGGEGVDGSAAEEPRPREETGESGEASAPSAVARAAALLEALGFELFAHAERPLTFKLSGRDFPRVPGRPYGYPYIDVWFCHGWEGGPFSLQSAGYGVPMPRELVFPRRKVLFAGLPLWAFHDPRASLSNYYGDGDWFGLCVGHSTFHRQERKFSETAETQRFDGRMPCTQLARHFAFASAPEGGLPRGIADDLLLRHLRAWLQLYPEPQWALDPDGPAGEGEAPLEVGRALESWRVARDELVAPLRLAGGALRLDSLENASTTGLIGNDGRALHYLTEAAFSLKRPRGGRCDALLRWRPLDEARGGLDTQLLGAEVASGLGAGTQLVEAADGMAFRLEVPSCICRHRAGSLALQWVAEDAW